MYNLYMEAVDGATKELINASRQEAIDFIKTWTGQKANKQVSGYYVADDGISTVRCDEA